MPQDLARDLTKLPVPALLPAYLTSGKSSSFKKLLFPPLQEGDEFNGL